MKSSMNRTTWIRRCDALSSVGALALLVLLTTRYLMPFRMDDILHMDWAQHHTFFGAWDPVHGSIVRSFRPVFAASIWLLTHTAGTAHYMPWHVVLVGSFLIALAYAGRTARYLAKRPTALYFTVGLYWIAFLPILNVLFWYGDLTFTLELLFITPAWYYGLRGLLEGRPRSLMIAITSGIIAVMTKEPAIVLVHGVLLGTLLVRWSEIRIAWKPKSGTALRAAVGYYALFIAVTLFIFFASPTKSNRFLSLGSGGSGLWQQLFERSDYYDSILNRMLPRLLIFFPIFYTSISRLSRKNLTHSSRQIHFVIALAIAAVASLGGSSILQVAVAIVLTTIAAAVDRDSRAKLLQQLPFLLCALITMLALLITKMIVKTQLTELAILLLVLAGIGWSTIIADAGGAFTVFLAKRSVRLGLSMIAMVGLIVAGVAFFPTVSRQEALLRGVRDVRANANDAVKWAAKELPLGSTVVLPDYKLYGINAGDDLTTASDATKVASQYPFPGGYIFYYFPLLHRTDFRELHLEDSTRLGLQLDSLRAQPKSYLMLQSELDYRRFRLAGSEPLLQAGRDSLVFGSYQGGYHCEIWHLGK